MICESICPFPEEDAFPPKEAIHLARRRRYQPEPQPEEWTDGPAEEEYIPYPPEDAYAPEDFDDPADMPPAEAYDEAYDEQPYDEAYDEAYDDDYDD